VRRSLLVLLVAVAFPSSAAAAPVLVLGHDGRAAVRNDPFVSGPALTPAPARTSSQTARADGLMHADVGVHAHSAMRAYGPRGHARAVVAKRRKRAPQITVLTELARLNRIHAIDGAAYRTYVAGFRAALATEKRLGGTRRRELAAVTETMHQIAASHQLTASRLPAVFATLGANQRWWTSGPLLSSGQRVEFAGSQLVWEYYPGRGIQIQVLGSFGKANGLYTGGPANYPAMEQLLTQLIPLAARRGGGLAWEYYFNFDGGSPPWTSAMSQATGLEALARAYQATGNGYYLNVATRALPIFSVAPPVGVKLTTSLGTRFLQYTFAPDADIINAFLQTLIGLFDFAHISGNQTAAALFAVGDAQAQSELPAFDTGAWSLYQPGIEDTLEYHQLVSGFLQGLCARTGAPVYCTTAQHFQAYLKIGPGLTQLTTRARTSAGFELQFRLSKYSHVGITLTRGAQTVFATSADFGYGVHSFTIERQSQAGMYGVTLTATDLAGNFARTTGSLQVAR
jgi:D-glucuronyl C5-epimerase-like protein